MKRAALSVGLAALLACATIAPLVADSGHGSSQPRWWKGNTHTHTLWSDGDAAPEQVAGWYQDSEYDFLVFTDHDLLVEGETWIPVSEEGPLAPAHVAALEAAFGPDWVVTRPGQEGSVEMRLKTLREVREKLARSGSLLLVQGEEVSAQLGELPVHVNGMNLAEPIEPRSGSTILEVIQNNIDAIVAQGARLGRPVLAHVNHPNFYWSIGAKELAAIQGERFFEVYNGHPSVNTYGDDAHMGTEELWDLALRHRMGHLALGPLYGLATDDGHDYHESSAGNANPGRGWIMVRADRLDAGSLIAAMNRGDFYASTGVTLRDVSFDGKRLVVEIEEEEGVEYETSFIVGPKPRSYSTPPAPVEPTTANPAVFEPSGNPLYIRAKVVSSRPHPNPSVEGELECAWTQPVVPEESEED